LSLAQIIIGRARWCTLGHAGERVELLFAHRDGVETNWALYTPIIDAWAAKNPEVFPNYFAGSWGPDCGNRLLERDGRAWRNDIG